MPLSDSNNPKDQDSFDGNLSSAFDDWMHDITPEKGFQGLGDGGSLSDVQESNEELVEGQSALDTEEEAHHEELDESPSFGEERHDESLKSMDDSFFSMSLDGDGDLPQAFAGGEDSSLSDILDVAEEPMSTQSFGLSLLEAGFDMEPEPPPEPGKTIRFAAQIATPMGEFLASQTSLQSLDIFEGGDADGMDGSSSLQSSIINDEEDDDESFVSATLEEEDEETKIKRQMMYALGGVGLFALIGLGFKKIANAFSKNDEPEVGLDITNAADVADAAANVNDVATLAVANDGGSSVAAMAVEANNQAAFHASASASESQIGAGAFGFAGNQGAATGAQGMSAAQTQVLQSMAVNAASNAASSAATASSAIATTAATAAGVGVAAGAAASVATLATVVSAVLSFCSPTACILRLLC
jgi:hypothetical protein